MSEHCWPLPKSVEAEQPIQQYSAPNNPLSMASERSVCSLPIRYNQTCWLFKLKRNLDAVEAHSKQHAASTVHWNSLNNRSGWWLGILKICSDFHLILEADLSHQESADSGGDSSTIKWGGPTQNFSWPLCVVSQCSANFQTALAAWCNGFEPWRFVVCFSLVFF